MSKRRQISTDSFSVEGRVELVLKNEHGVIVGKRVGKNALSPANKVRVAYKAADYINQLSLSPMGRYNICSLDGGYINSSSPYYGKLIGSTLDKQTCIVLLDLTGVTPTDRYIPIFDTDGSLMADDRVIGWINSATSVGANAFLGSAVKDVVKQAVANKLKSIEKRGFFDTNKGIGTVTHVAVMPGFGLPTTLSPVYSGFSVWQCLAKTNENSFILPPGIQGITGADEILVLNQTGDIPSYKINMRTGASENSTKTVTDVFGSACSSIDHLKAFKKLSASRVAVVYSTYLRIIDYDATGVPTQSLSVSVDDPDYVGLYTNDTYLYCWPGYKNGSSGSYATSINRIKLSDLTYSTVTKAAQAILGGLPATWTGTDAIFISANGNGEVYVGNAFTNEMLVCTDPSDVCGTLIGTLALPGYGISLFDTSDSLNVMYCGNQLFSMDTPNRNGERIYKDISNPDTVSDGFGVHGAPNLPWISFKNYANWYNLYPLSSPITKTSSNTLELSYFISHV